MAHQHEGGPRSKDFPRTGGVLAEGSAMVRRVLFTGAASLFLSVILPAGAQPDFSGSLSGSSLRLSSLSLSEASLFSFATAFNRMETSAPDFLPTVNLANVTVRPRPTTNPTGPLEDSSKEVVEVRKTSFFDYAGGEVGAFYGSGSGKFGREVEAGYIMGTVGNEHLQISAGASYEHSSGRQPRFGR